MRGQTLEDFMDPVNAIEAASHPNPYPYYATLRRSEASLVHDPSLKFWVASKAGVVLEVLHNPALVVRPPQEPVPKTIDQSAAGAVFGQLVRMNEGKYHHIAKTALEVALQSTDSATVSGIAQRRAVDAAAATQGLEANSLTEWAFDVPMRCVGELIGTPDWPDLTDRVREFVACLSAQSSPAQLATAAGAAEVLQTRLQPIATANPASPIVQEARSNGLAAHPTALPNSLVSNLVGLFSQTFEATAGLIGNCIVNLITHPDIHTELRGNRAQVNAFVREVSRYDPSVQNTRRFAASAVRVGSVLVQPGETILVLLGSAGRDDALYAEAERFRLDRAEPTIVGFSSGRHQCPGEHIARAIASGAITYLFDSGMALSQDHIAWTYRPSPNARIPQFSPP
jgi:cytochrome P450